MQQPPQWGPHLVPTARPMPTLHPMAIFHPIFSKLPIPNSHQMPLQAALGRQSFVHINMRTNQWASHSTPFHRRSIPIQFIQGDPQVQADPYSKSSTSWASTTYVTSVDYVAVRGHANQKTFTTEHQQPDRCVTRAARGRPKKNPAQRQVEFPQGLSPIPA